MSVAAQQHISTRMKQVKLSRLTRWIHVALLPQQILSATGSSGRSRICDANSTPTTKDAVGRWCRASPCETSPYSLLQRERSGSLQSSCCSLAEGNVNPVNAARSSRRSLEGPAQCCAPITAQPHPTGWSAAVSQHLPLPKTPKDLYLFNASA